MTFSKDRVSKKEDQLLHTTYLCLEMMKPLDRRCFNNANPIEEAPKFVMSI